MMEEKPAGEASQAGGKGTTKGKKTKAKAVVKKSRKIDELVQSDLEEEEPEDQDAAPPGLLTEITGPSVLVTDPPHPPILTLAYCRQQY